MVRTWRMVLLALGVALALAACNHTSSDSEPAGFSASKFGADSAMIDHPCLPLLPGQHYTYEGEGDEEEEVRVEIFVAHYTVEILGVECAVVVDREYEDGELVEETFDWYAKDKKGNIWYLGEASTEYEEGEPVSTEGSWEAGVDGAVAGYLIKATSVVGDSYQQEFLEGEAEDMAEVIAVDGEVEVDGTLYDICVQTREWTPLEPDDEEFKYYVLGIGLVLVEEEEEPVEWLAEYGVDIDPDIDEDDFSDPTHVDNEYFPLVPDTVYTYEVETDEGDEEIVVEVLDSTRNVMGIDCVVVRDRVYLDGELVEDTHDWFAQDDEGNVWYFGEEVDNYVDGTLEDHDGAWEAGVDGAVPGIQMLADPRVGDSYRQEYWEGEAEDLAEVIALEVEIELVTEDEFTTLMVREWNPLEEDSVEFKYYAPGIGLVREEDEEGEEQVDLVDLVTP